MLTIFKKKALAVFSGVDMHKTMPEKTPKITKEAFEKEVLTRGKMIPIIEDLKDFIKTTARGTENVLRKEIQRLDNKIELNQHAVTEHTKMIKNLDVKIDGVHSELKETEVRLSAKIDKIGERLDDHETRITTIETARL
ncbi:MAG: hypothetical protein HYY43_06055 [Deltaproteobacteria bacterium]|nr:hypothetical protein [Deltaproteobacteria bacterium]MBI2975133.1 hypothetical protein [Deltaproteobacteria bacterium]